MVCSWLLELCRHDDWDIKIIWKQILLSTNRGYSKHLLTCSGVFGKQADLKSRTQHAGSCGRWLESTIRRRGFSRRHMRSRLMFTREQEEKHQDFWNNDAWKDDFKSELSERQTKYSIPGKDPCTNSPPNNNNSKLGLATWHWPKNLPIGPPNWLN